MSVNREHVVWQSSNGLWNIGFWDFFEVNQDDDNFDYEWDVQYTDEFNFVVRNLATQEMAENAWRGRMANPGGAEIVEYSEANAKLCETYDKRADAYFAERNANRLKGWGA